MGKVLPIVALSLVLAALLACKRAGPQGQSVTPAEKAEDVRPEPKPVADSNPRRTPCVVRNQRGPQVLLLPTVEAWNEYVDAGELEVIDAELVRRHGGAWVANGSPCALLEQREGLAHVSVETSVTTTVTGWAYANAIEVPRSSEAPGF